MSPIAALRRRRRVIGIDASRLSVDRLTGTETYTYQLLLAIADIDPPDAIELYVNAHQPPSDLPRAGDPVCIPFPRLWTHLRLSAELARRRPGVLFVPAHVVPAFHPPSVVTIHDVGYVHHPEAHPAADRRMLHWTTKWSVTVAHRVIAISEHTKRDLQQWYRVPEGKIDVIANGVAAAFVPSTPEFVAATRVHYGLADRYVLAVGTVQPRKNLARLASAVRRLNDEGCRIDLVVAGKDGWLADDVKRDLDDNGALPFVRFLGYVPDVDLPGLYAGADVFAMPSLYEGFGMPVLEAMACGTPVVAADRSALPEVAGGAALLCDPFNVRSIAEALSSVLTDDARRRSLIEAGTARAASFTWEVAAERTLGVLRKVRDS